MYNRPQLYDCAANTGRADAKWKKHEEMIEDGIGVQANYLANLNINFGKSRSQDEEYALIYVMGVIYNYTKPEVNRMLLKYGFQEVTQAQFDTVKEYISKKLALNGMTPNNIISASFGWPVRDTRDGVEGLVEMEKKLKYMKDMPIREQGMLVKSIEQSGAAIEVVNTINRMLEFIARFRFRQANMNAIQRKENRGMIEDVNAFIHDFVDAADLAIEPELMLALGGRNIPKASEDELCEISIQLLQIVQHQAGDVSKYVKCAIKPWITNGVAKRSFGRLYARAYFENLYVQCFALTRMK